MILASSSPRRRELLEELGFELEIQPADIDETRFPGEKPVELVERLAREKAQAALIYVRCLPADHLLVAADTIVWTEDDVLGKPRDEADARRMLAELSGRAHNVSSGVCVMLLADNGRLLERKSFVETTEVEFWPLSPAQIADYVACGEPMDKAGAYGIQGRGRLLVKGIRGDYFNVVGLPVSRLVREIQALGDDSYR